jgi:hypothetical protein
MLRVGRNSAGPRGEFFSLAVGLGVGRGRVAQAFDLVGVTNKSGCPSIRTKSVSRAKFSCRCFEHRVFRQRG